MSQPLVSVVIPTHNRKEKLARLIKSILESDYPKDKLEIIVVDDASTDNTFEYIKKKYPQAKIIRNEEEKLLAESRNIGIKASKGKYIFLIDDDGKNLQVSACGWEEGSEQMGTHGDTTIPLDSEQSIIAEVARTRQAVVVNDVRDDPRWLPNELMPNTRSEMAVPLIVGDTGLERSTGSLVAHVKQIRNAYPEIVNSIFEAGEKIVEKAVQALKEGDLEVLGRLMLINHGLLFAIGVSHEKLDKLVHAALRAGAYGAKLTGAGGGGCMIAIAPSKLVDQVISSIEQAGGTAFSAKINVEGARIEN